MNFNSQERVFASATPLEQGFALFHGKSLYVGVRCRVQKPYMPVTSYGFAGALTDELKVGTPIRAQKVVDKSGKTLWEGNIPGPRGAKLVTVVSTDHLVNGAKERAKLRDRTGADVVDMETDIYAGLGFLNGYARVITDTPSNRLVSVNILWNGPFACWALSQISF